MQATPPQAEENPIESKLDVTGARECTAWLPSHRFLMQNCAENALFIAERLNWVELRCLVGWVITKEYAYDHGKTDCDGDGG